MTRDSDCDHDFCSIISGIFKRVRPVVLIVCLKPALLVAGAPLVTDDPGILEPGSWESILAVSGESTGAGDIYQLPVLDVSLGITPNSQLSFYLPHFWVNPDDSVSDFGLTTATIGYKWRFYTGQTMEWAIAAHYTGVISSDLTSEDGSDEINVLNVPLLASWQRGDWTWLGQTGYSITDTGEHFWDYGLAVSRQLGDSVSLMAEVYGFADLSFADNALNYQLGMDFEITPAWHVLASAGSRIRSPDPAGFRLDYNFYVGLQWFTN